MKKNILLLNVHTFLSTFILYYICDILFYIERGLTSSQYISFVGVTYLVQLLLEVPLGVLADKYNKKFMLLGSNLLFIISTIIFVDSYSYLGFLLAVIFSALSSSLSSGIVNSFLYESILDKGEFQKILFFNSCFYNVSYMLAMLIGGYVGSRFGLSYTYYLTLIPLCLDFLVILLVNYKYDNKIKIKNGSIPILKQGLLELKNNPYILKLIVKSAVLFAGIKLLEESHPQYSENIGLSLIVISVYTAFILLFSILGSFLGSKVKASNYKFILNIHPLIVGLCIILIGILNNILGIGFILIIYIFSESFDNVMISELHNNISSTSRVTIESIKEFVLGIVGVVFSLLMVILLKFVSISVMYIVIGGIIILLEVIGERYAKKC